MAWEETLEEHKRRTRSRLAAAAANVASTEGVAGTRMSDVARVAGVTRKTLYSYFPDVESLLVAQVEEEVARLRSRFAQRTGESPLEHIRMAFADALQTWSDDPTAGLLGLGAGLSPTAADAIRRALDGLRDDLIRMLEEGVRDGRLRPDLDRELIADLMLGLLLGGREHAARTGRPVDEVAREVERIALDGIRTPR
jgi:AcrR family transcriptional regulator